MVGELRRRGLAWTARPGAVAGILLDVVGDLARHVVVRDLATLREHHDGLDGGDLADRLVRNAARASAGIGAACGGVAAVEWAVPPTLLTAPVLLGAETAGVVAVELKLVGELHSVYRIPLPEGVAPRAIALLQAWSQQRGVNPLVSGAGAGAVLGTAARTKLRAQLLKRLGRNLTTLGPFLTGAAVASYLNQRATRALGQRVRDDLRRRRPAVTDGPTRPEMTPRPGQP
ncbi:hypothetical protein GCM10010201_06010 [Pilimelia columellifera subsp. columellifera]|uniref:Uncharacterized protein n=2 Tax=Pilimelia TaxID=53370 RepID=A0ABP6ADA6_9ACTN